MKINKALTSFLAVVFLINPLGARIDAAPEAPPAQEASVDKISLDLKNVDIVELLRIISLKTGKTIVPSKLVSGRITVYLSNVAFNDVLDIIVLTQGLALSRKDNVYYVKTEAEYRKDFGRDYVDQRKIQTIKLNYAKPSVIFTALSQLKSDVGKIMVDEASGTIILIDIPEKLELMAKTVTDLDRPLSTTIYDLSYMKASDAKAQFTAAVTQGTGEVIVDERSGKAIISDLPQKMQKMNMLVRELDEASRQVYVEADIVELSLSDEFERGIDWRLLFEKAAKGGLLFAGTFGAPSTSALQTVYQQISVGSLTTDDYAGILKFLGTYGKTSVISQPRIAVVNNEEANVMVGVREAYVTQSQSQATGSIVTSDTIEFIDVGVKLKLVPKIGADGFIIMKIKPEVSSVLRRDTLSDLTTIPIIQTSQSETVVKVKDGAMIMLAGMTRLEDADTIKGWPVLSKLPVVGAFFGYRTKTKKRTEVIIFLTPHLTTGSTGLRGDEITKILPRIYLPPNLQEKVDRDAAVDSKLTVMENPPSAEKIVDPAEIKAAEKGKQATEKAIKDAADKAQKTLEENKKATEKTVKPPSAERKKAAAAEAKAKQAADKLAKQAQEKAAKAAAQEAAQADKLAKQAQEKAAKAAAQEAAQADKIAKAQAADALKLSQEMAKEVSSKAKLVAKPKVSVIKVVKPESGQSAKDYFQKGLQAQADANPQEAISNFIQATKLDPKYASAYNSLGVVYEEQGKFDKAEKAYLKAVSVDQSFAPAYANLALFNESRKDYTKALEYWRKRALYGDADNVWTQQALERVKALETKK